jgi:predicted  nucleic acid-binding Zn-ribbon protein
MTEREELQSEIEALETRRSKLGRDSWNAAEAGDLSLCEDLDGEYDEVSDKIGRLKRWLYELDARIARREKNADAAYGRSR